MKNIISTVGTSIFENYLNKFGRKDSGFNDIYENLKKENFQYKSWSEFEENDIKPLFEKFKSKAYHQYPDISAEIASNIAIQKELGEEVKVHLLATDTILSVLAAELIEAWFEDESNKKQYPEIKEVILERPVPGFENNDTENHVVKDLRINSKDDYEKGATNILEVLNRITDKNTILNITGGYKAIVPLLTVWAQIKKVQLKYLFNESELAQSELHPLTMGQLPLNLDWNVVEAFKPILKNYLLDKLTPLALSISRGDVTFDDNKKVFIRQNQKAEMPDLPNTFHQVLHGITSSKLVAISDEKISLTALGRLFANTQLSQEDYSGYVMEVALHKLFFNRLDKVEVLKNYSLSERPANLSRFFKVVDRGKKQIQLCDENDTDKKEIGDMDVSLIKGETLVWAEAKAFQAFCTLKDDIGKNKDYFFQLKARAKAVIDSQGSVGNMEILLLVFKFVFKGLNDDDAFEESAHFNSVFNHLNDLNNDEELKGRASFRCIGIKVPIEFNSNRIDMTAFYKCRYDNWEFEEITLNTKP